MQSNGTNLFIQGRLIWIAGNLFAGKAKLDFNTKAPVIGKDGQPVIEYGFGLSIPKIDPRTGAQCEDYVKLWEALHKEAFTLFPGGQIPPDFAMKYKDGDIAIDKHGKRYSEREGYPGCLVLTCTTQIPVKYFRFEAGNNILINEGIKCGDYVNAQLVIKAHPAIGQGKAGLYVNPGAVQLIQAGKEIVNAPNGDQIFGQNIPAYAGQVVADTAPAMPGQVPLAPAPLAPAMPGVAPMTPTPGIAPQVPGQVPAAPHYGVIPATHQPTPAPQAPPVPGPGQVPLAPLGHPGQVVPGPAYAPPAAAPLAPPVPMPGQVPLAPPVPGPAPMPGVPPVGNVPLAPQMPMVPGIVLPVQ